MKIQLILLCLFVVATLAHRTRDEHEQEGGERRVNRRFNRRHHQENDNQLAADAEVQAEDADAEDSAPVVDEEVKDRKSSRGRNCGHHGRRRHRPHVESENGEQENQGEVDASRKHHHHHRHHHRNRTTTTTSTASPNGQESNTFNGSNE